MLSRILSASLLLSPLGLLADSPAPARIIAADLAHARDLSVVVPNSGDLFLVFREAVESAFYGKRSPKEALDWAVRQWNARL